MSYKLKNKTGVPIYIGKKEVEIDGKTVEIDDILSPHEERVMEGKKSDVRDSEKLPNVFLDGKRQVNIQVRAGNKNKK